MQKKLKYFIYAIVIGFIVSSCQRDPYKFDASDIAIKSSFKRFDQAFFGLDSSHLESSLPKLAQVFPPFFQTHAGDLYYWQLQWSDPLQQKLYAKTQEVFTPFEPYGQQLTEAAKNYYYHFGTEDTIQFYTYISRLDFDYPALFAENMCFVGLDMYLGTDYEEYAGRPSYLNFEHKPQYLIRDCMEAVIKAQVNPELTQGNLLDNMIYYGKILHLLKRTLPTASNHDLIKYTEEQWQFCKANEKSIWSYFIENQLLYANSEDAKRQFVHKAPFSKFRTSKDREIPGRIAQWVGWQIVEGYAVKNGKLRPVEEILHENDSKKILGLSGYRP